MRDFYPEDFAERQVIFDAWRTAAQAHGFLFYDAPIVETMELLERKAGEEISEQIYTFADKSDRQGDAAADTGLVVFWIKKFLAGQKVWDIQTEFIHNLFLLNHANNTKPALTMTNTTAGASVFIDIKKTIVRPAYRTMRTIYITDAAFNTPVFIPLGQGLDGITRFERLCNAVCNRCTLYIFF